MSKGPYSGGRIAAYLAASVIIGIGGANNGLSGCNDRREEPKVCTTNASGERDCPLQTGRQDP